MPQVLQFGSLEVLDPYDLARLGAVLRANPSSRVEVDVGGRKLRFRPRLAIFPASLLGLARHGGSTAFVPPARTERELETVAHELLHMLGDAAPSTDHEAIVAISRSWAHSAWSLGLAGDTFMDTAQSTMNSFSLVDYFRALIRAGARQTPGVFGYGITPRRAPAGILVTPPQKIVSDIVALHASQMFEENRVGLVTGTGIGANKTITASTRNNVSSVFGVVLEFNGSQTNKVGPFSWTVDGVDIYGNDMWGLAAGQTAQFDGATADAFSQGGQLRVKAVMLPAVQGTGGFTYTPLGFAPSGLTPITQKDIVTQVSSEVDATNTITATLLTRGCKEIEELVTYGTSVEFLKDIAAGSGVR